MTLINKLFKVQKMTDTKMFLLGAISLMVVTTSLGDKPGHTTQNVSHSLSLLMLISRG